MDTGRWNVRGRSYADFCGGRRRTRQRRRVKSEANFRQSASVRDIPARFGNDRCHERSARRDGRYIAAVWGSRRSVQRVEDLAATIVGLAGAAPRGDGPGPVTRRSVASLPTVNEAPSASAPGTVTLRTPCWTVTFLRPALAPVSTSVPLPLVTRPPEPTIEPVMLAFDPPTVLTVRRWPPLSSVLPIVSDPEETWMIPSPPSTIGSEMVLLRWFRIVVDPVEFNSTELLPERVQPPLSVTL